MLIVSDFQGFSTVAENINSLYNTIAYDLGLEEWQQEKLVDELIYQFGNADDRMIELDNDNTELKEMNDELEDENEGLENDNFLFEEKNDELGDRIIALEEKNDELRNKLENIEKSKEAAYKAKLDKIKAILDDEENVDNEEIVDNEETVSVEESQDHVTATSEENNLSTPWCANVSKFSKMLADLKLMMVNAYKEKGVVINGNPSMLDTRQFMTDVNVVIKYGNKVVSDKLYLTVTNAKEEIKQVKERFKGAEKKVSYSLKINKVGQQCIERGVY